MYRIPTDLDLSPAVGEFTTELRVGQFDFQFHLGPVQFAVESAITLVRDGKEVGRWEPGRWPDPGFYEIMNVVVRRCDVVSDTRIEIEFENGLTMILEDSSDQFESMSIHFEGDASRVWII